MNIEARFLRAPRAVLTINILISLSCISVCRADDFGDISVTADAMYTGNTFHGYAAMRVTLENRSDQRSHVINLNYPNGDYPNYGNNISRISRTVALAPGARDVVTLFQPPLPVFGNGAIAVDVDGGRAGEIHAPNANNHCQAFYERGHQTATVLISRSLDYDAVSRVLNVSKTGSSSPYYTSSGDSVEGIRAEMPAAEWSADWLAYTPFDVIAVRPTDLASMPAETAAALTNYVRAGGSIIVFGSDGIPEAWRSGTKRGLHQGADYAAGLGDSFVLDSQNPYELDSDTVSALRKNMNDSAGYWRSLPRDSDSMNSSLHLVENLQIPTRGIISLMLLFVIVIGPLNIIVLNRRKRRTWMLCTIPAISLTTTLLVFAYSLLREGITPTVRISGLTILNQTSHHAETIGAEGIYCPLTPGGGLHFDGETEATPLVNVDYSSGTAREIDWSQSQHFTRGWAAARVPAFFHLRKSETRRERLQVENRDGHLDVLNGLGAPIKSLWYADSAMNIYVAQDVAAGESAALSPSKPPQSSGHAGPEGLFRDIGFVARADGLGDNASGYLTPNTYIAVLDSNPFIENALGSGTSLTYTKTSAVVFGFLDPSDRL
jgi:hypothetical protein